LTAARVMSCSWRPELPMVRGLDEPAFEFLGVKKRVKRLGVMGGGFFSLRLPVEAGGGDDGSRSDIGSNEALEAPGEENMLETMKTI
jgi:hypothetical protein